MLKKQSFWCTDVIFLTLILSSLFFIFLGIRPLFVPDEGRYAEISREMVESGNYLTPYLNYIKYFEKPILFYWLQVIAIKLGGLNLWSLRSVNAVLGLIGCLTTYVTARHLYDRSTGILAALILGTSFLYFLMVHMVNLDLTVTIWITLCLYAFLIAIHMPLGKERKLTLWAASAFAALALLTKGLIGIIFPILIIFSWIALLNEWRLVKNLHVISSTIVFLIIAIPWHLLIQSSHPEFFYYYFVEQHLLRYITKDVGHYEPFWFFIPYLIIGFFPWIVFLPVGVVKNFSSLKNIQHFKKELFFILWVVLIFTFFSFSKSKLIPYILPLFPPLAILTSRYLTDCIKKNKKLEIKLALSVLVLLSFVIALALGLFTHYVNVLYPITAQKYLNFASLILILGCVFTLFASFYNIRVAIVGIIVWSYFFFLTTLSALPFIDNRTIKPLAMELKSRLKPEDTVVAYNEYYQDLPFYLERKVNVLNWHNELAYGMEHQKDHG